jgi:gonadotropin-releasing hormone receptor
MAAETPVMETLNLMESRISQFSNIVPFTDGNTNFSNSSLTNRRLFDRDISTQDVSPEELLSIVGLPEIRDIRTLIALPMDECQRISALNVTLWTLLTAYANSSGEFKCLDRAPEFTNKIAVKTVVLTVMAVLSFVGNTWTIMSIKKNRSGKRSHQSWSAVYTLILHLSIVDLLVTLFCLAGEAAWSYTVAWIAGNAECKIFKFLQMSSLYLSTFVLVLIGVDRFVVVKYPMKSLNTARRLNRLIVFVWVLSLALSIPQVSLHLNLYSSGNCKYFEFTISPSKPSANLL